MDGLSFAGAFSTIVQLVGQFKADRNTASANDYEEFRAWLAENRHDDLIKLLEQNSATVIGIKVALSQSQREIISLLQDVDRKLAILCASSIALQPLASAIHPEAAISNDALAFLCEFENTGSDQAMEFSNLVAGRMILSSNPASKEFDHADWRFYEDDIRAMVRLEFLQFGRAHPGGRTFLLTRKGSDIARAAMSDSKSIARDFTANEI